MKLSTLRASRFLLATGIIAGTTLLAACGGGSLSTSKQAAIAFVSPPPNATAEVGKPLTVTLDVTNPQAFTGNIYVVGQGALGTTTIPVQAPYTGTIAVPANLPLGSYTLTAVGQTSAAGTQITAATTIQVVTNPAIPIALQLPQGGLTFEAIGERLPITVPDATQGLHYQSTAPAIVTVSQAGVVTAQQAGDTTIRVSCVLCKITAPPNGTFIGSVPVHVLAPTLLPSTTQLDFGKQAKGTTSPAQSVTLTNQAAYPVSILAVDAGTVFPVSGNCKSSSPLASGASCTVSVSFAPTATGGVNGALLIVNSAVIAQTRILLSGTGE